MADKGSAGEVFKESSNEMTHLLCWKTGMLEVDTETNAAV